MKGNKLLFIMQIFLCALLVGLLGAHDPSADMLPSSREPEPQGNTLLVALGDSLTHGTMNATNNATNTRNGYVQKIYESLDQVITVSFSQPFLDNQEKRIAPFIIPSNLGVDGSDIYSCEGKDYYKRQGMEESRVTSAYLCNKVFPSRLDDLYDSVLYPINLLNWKPVSQLDALIWLLKQVGHHAGPSHAIVILWLGNNDSSNATLGYGTNNPTFIPLPLDLLEDELAPAFLSLLRSREEDGTVSFDPYLLSSIERNLTEETDFSDQYNRILKRLKDEAPSAASYTDLFLCTLPYYSSAAYLIDSEGLEFYLQKVNPAYRVPQSFKRAATPGDSGAPVHQGDRISLFTFLAMYILLQQGKSVPFVNGALEVNGVQRDGLVLSEHEQHIIRTRIDSFNETITEAAQSRGAFVHLIDTGQFINDTLTGETPLIISSTLFNRQWGRGNSFTIDGVHPGYTTHILIANFILEGLNETLGLEAPLYDPSDSLQNDPYIDRDGDGWVEGPYYAAPGFADLLFFFKDPDDSDPAVEPSVPPDIWNRIAAVVVKELVQ